MYNEATARLAQRLAVEPEPNGYRYLTLDGIWLGRMRLDPNTDRWTLEYREGRSRARGD